MAHNLKKESEAWLEIVRMLEARAALLNRLERKGIQLPADHFEEDWIHVGSCWTCFLASLPNKTLRGEMKKRISATARLGNGCANIGCLCYPYRESPSVRYGPYIMAAQWFALEAEEDADFVEKVFGDGDVASEGALRAYA